MKLKKYIIIIVTTFLFSNSLFAETITEQLTTLNNLYKEGAITEEEFSKAKKLLLLANYWSPSLTNIPSTILPFRSLISL